MGNYLFIYFLIAYGISFAFVESMGPFNLFHHIREWANKIHPTFGELLDCMFCFPSWVGFTLSILNMTLFPMFYFTPMMILFNMPWYMTLIGDMFATASGVYILNALLEPFSKNEEI